MTKKSHRGAVCKFPASLEFHCSPLRLLLGWFLQATLRRHLCLFQASWKSETSRIERSEFSFTSRRSVDPLDYRRATSQYLWRSNFSITLEEQTSLITVDRNVFKRYPSCASPIFKYSDQLLKRSITLEELTENGRRCCGH